MSKYHLDGYSELLGEQYVKKNKVREYLRRAGLGDVESFTAEREMIRLFVESERRLEDRDASHLIGCIYQNMDIGSALNSVAARVRKRLEIEADRKRKMEKAARKEAHEKFVAENGGWFVRMVRAARTKMAVFEERTRPR